MNLRALWSNYDAGKKCARSFIDLVKYLYWIYSGALPVGLKHRLILRLRFDPPIGYLTLNARCNGGADAFIFSEVFQHRYYDFNLPSLPATVLDLGANIGLTALYFARKYPSAKIACLEPMPGNFALLRANLQSNGVAAKTFAKAVSVEDGPIYMQIAANDYGHKSANCDDGWAMDRDTLRVDGISIPTLLAELGWTRIGLLKVDIEGYEGILLRERCEWLQQVDAICIECHDSYCEADLLELAGHYGFEQPKLFSGMWLLLSKQVL